MRTSRIAHLYEDPGPFASALVDVSRDTEDAARVVELRAREVREELVGAGAPAAVVDTLVDRLGDVVHEAAPVSRQLVVTERGVLLDEVVHARTDGHRATFDVLPDISHWIQREDTVVAFTLVVIDHEGGDVSAYRSDVSAPESEQSAGGADVHEQKVRGGAGSHLRMQRVAEDVWRRNAKEVAELVREQVRRGYRLVLVAGDPKARGALREQLAHGLQAELVDLEHGSRSMDGGDEALERAIREAVGGVVTARRLDVAHELQDRLGREGAVATGTDDVLAAAVRGQADTVLLDPARTADRTVDVSDYPGLSLGAVGVPDAPVRTDLALVAAAAVTGADVAVAGAAVLRGATVAALLRWEQPAGTD